MTSFMLTVDTKIIKESGKGEEGSRENKKGGKGRGKGELVP